MIANPSSTILKTDDAYPNYPGFGDPDDVHERIMLLKWIMDQIANRNVQGKEGEYILATDGRILGVGDNEPELWRRIVTSEPSLANARVVGYRVPLSEW